MAIQFLIISNNDSPGSSPSLFIITPRSILIYLYSVYSSLLRLNKYCHKQAISAYIPLHLNFMSD